MTKHMKLKLIRVTEQHAINKITVRNVRLTTRDLSVVRSRPKIVIRRSDRLRWNKPVEAVENMRWVLNYFVKQLCVS